MHSSWVLLSICAIASRALAHTEIWYPAWRNDSFLPPFSQTIYPCAGISDTPGTSRTPWPLDGGSLNVTLKDSAAYIFINIGLGVNATNFNYTLFAAPLNETGAGNLCFPKLTLPSGMPIEDGTQATLQFATASNTGMGLYNCADITFSSNATLLPADQCQNSTNIVLQELGTTATSTSTDTSSSSTAPSASPSQTKSGAAGLTPSIPILLGAGILGLVL